MADNTLKTRLLSAHNTLAFWATCTTKPMKGEVCYAVDPNTWEIQEIKIGNGTDLYKDLPAFTPDNFQYALEGTPSTASTTTSVFASDVVLTGSNGGSNSTANIRIPAGTTSKAGVMTTADKAIVNAAADTRLTGGTTGSTAAGNAYVTVNTKTVSSAGATSTGTSTLKVDGLGTMAFESSADFVSNVSTATYGTSGVTINQTKGGTATPVANFGSAVKSNITTAIGSSPASSSTNVPTDYAVWKAIDDLPEPMIFKGSVGTGGTTATLPTTGLSAYNGWTYKVITAGTYGGVVAEVGDTLICNGTEWVLIPSGDEPSGTVTSVGVSSTASDSPLSVTGSPITSSGTIDIEHAAGNSSTAKYGATANASGLGGSIKVPYLKADKYGHITTAGEYTLTNVTSAQVKTVKVDNASTADFATSAGDAAKLNGVDASNYLEADDIIAGTGIIVTTAAGAATVSADLATTTKYNGAAATVTAAQSTAVASRVYAVQPDKNGDLAVYIPWTDNDTKVTSVGNHYTPSSSGTFSPAAGGTTTNISNTAVNYIVGLQKDAKGHITGVVSGTLTADKNTDTNYYTTAFSQTTAVDGFTATAVGNNSAVKGDFSIPAATTGSAGVMTTAQVDTLSKVKSATTAAEGLTKKPSGTAPISVNANNVISHNNSGVTAGTYGTTAAQTPGYNSTFAIPWVTVDATGHVTGASTASVKIPATDNTNYYTTAINQTTAADSFSATVVGNNAAVKGNFSIPGASTNSAGVMTTAQVDKLAGLKQATAGSGLSNSDSGDTRTINHASTITAGSVGPSSNATVSLAWGKTSAVSVPYISYNNTGHTTAASTKSISFTMPSNPNTDSYVSSASLYSNADQALQLDLVRSGSSPATISAVLSQTLILDGNFTA